eukprot:TRINITY_DN815_c0_g1_i1.p1 TRINITY_DN815_c0_g1~~TRINITY_DN815_c0_g1_i1.p1  ORF type:complete len:301 (+),score=41.10 TRINITY_DN815_c0_g1_i1:203-1105(+)
MSHCLTTRSLAILALLALFISHTLTQTDEEIWDEEELLMGGWYDIDVNNLSDDQHQVIDWAVRNVAKSDGFVKRNGKPDLKVVKILSGSEQVVAGFNYDLLALVEDSKRQRALLDFFVFEGLNYGEEPVSEESLYELTFSALLRGSSPLKLIANASVLTALNESVHTLHNNFRRGNAKYRVKKWVALRVINHASGDYLISNYILESTGNQVERFESLFRIDGYFLEGKDPISSYMLKNMYTIKVPLSTSANTPEKGKTLELAAAKCKQIKSYIGCSLKAKCDGESFLKTGVCKRLKRKSL